MHLVTLIGYIPIFFGMNAFSQTFPNSKKSELLVRPTSKNEQTINSLNSNQIEIRIENLLREYRAGKKLTNSPQIKKINQEVCRKSLDLMAISHSDRSLTVKIGQTDRPVFEVGTIFATQEERLPDAAFVAKSMWDELLGSTEHKRIIDDLELKHYALTVTSGLVPFKKVACPTCGPKQHETKSRDFYAFVLMISFAK